MGNEIRHPKPALAAVAVAASEGRCRTPRADPLAALDSDWPGSGDLVLLCAFAPNVQGERTFEQLRAHLLAEGFRAPAARHLIRTSRFLHRTGRNTYKVSG